MAHYRVSTLVKRDPPAPFRDEELDAMLVAMAPHHVAVSAESDGARLIFSIDGSTSTGFAAGLLPNLPRALGLVHAMLRSTIEVDDSTGVVVTGVSIDLTTDPVHVTQRTPGHDYLSGGFIQ